MSISIRDDIALATSPPIQSSSSHNSQSLTSIVLFSCVRLALTVPFQNAYILWDVYHKPQPEDSGTEIVEEDDKASDTVDASGYILPKQRHIPLSISLMKTYSDLIYLPSEGLLAPWKSLQTALLIDVATESIRPLLIQTISTLMSPIFPSFPFQEPQSNLQIASATAQSLAADAVIAVVMSPLEVLRVRMVVQASDEKCYKGIWQGLSLILSKPFQFSSILPSLLNSVLMHTKQLISSLLTTLPSLLVFDIAFDLLGLVLIMPLEMYVRREMMQGWEWKRTVVPIDRGVRAAGKGKSTWRSAMYRGWELRVSLLIFHKITSAVLLNLDIDEDY